MTVTPIPKRCAHCNGVLRPDLKLRREVTVVARDGRSYHASCYPIHLAEGVDR